MQISEMILLKDIWTCENISDYKVHFGRWNGEVRTVGRVGERPV